MTLRVKHERYNVPCEKCLPTIRSIAELRARSSCDYLDALPDAIPQVLGLMCSCSKNGRPDGDIFIAHNCGFEKAVRHKWRRRRVQKFNDHAPRLLF